jgi:hypothetical protein
MTIGIMPFIVIPILVIFVGLLLIVYYSKKKLETVFEKEMKMLKRLRFSGKLDKKNYQNVKNRLEVEKLSSEQSAILEQMFNNEKIDSVTYMRMRKALHISMNQKLKKYNSFT